MTRRAEEFIARLAGPGHRSITGPLALPVPPETLLMAGTDEVGNPHTMKYLNDGPDADGAVRFTFVGLLPD